MKRPFLWFVLVTILVILSGCPAILRKPPVLSIPDQTVEQGSVLELDLLDYVVAKTTEGLTFAVIDSVGEIVDSNKYRFDPDFTPPRKEEVQIEATNQEGMSDSDFFIITITPKIYEVTLQASPSQAGSVEGEGFFAHGTQVEVTAIPNELWDFVSWTEDATAISNKAHYTFSITDNRELVGNFTLKTHTLDLTTQGRGEVVKDPDKEHYGHGEIVTLNATATEGWQFVKWVVNERQFENALTEITMTEDTVAVAYFARMQYSLTVNVEGQGHVQKEIIFSPSGYEYETRIELTAIPDDGWQFRYWSGDLSGSENPQIITSDGDKEVTAVFIEKYTVTLSTDPPEGGSVEGEGFFAHGTQVEVTAIPNELWEFVCWTEDATAVSNEAHYTFSITDNRELVANFTLKTHTLDLTTQGRGEVAKDPDKEHYGHGEIVTLNATATEGWEFVKWVVNGQQFDNALTEITMTEDSSAVAYFARMQFSLTVNTEGQGHVKKEVIFSPSNYDYETEIQLTAVPDKGWDFVFWSGDLSGSDNPRVITIDSDKEVKAHFIKKYTVTVSANPPEGGIVAGEGLYGRGDQVEVAATPTAGWIFKSWTEDDQVVCTNPSFSFEAEEDRDLTAHFEAPKFVWGVPHSHTSYSDGVGTPALAYEYAMSQNIDFLIVTDHSNYFSGDEYDPENNQFLETKGSNWYSTRIQAEDHNAVYGDTFTALRGFEMSFRDVGHIDVYNTTNYVEWYTMPILDDFFEWLLYVYGEEGGQVIASFCHPFRPRDSFYDLAYVPELDKVIQMIEIGNGEPHRYTRAEPYYIKALDNGWHVGAINSQDNHNYTWGEPDNLTGIVVFQEGPEGIYEAMQSRRVYATETRRLEMTFLANGHWMGSIVSDKTLDFFIELYDPDVRIRRVDIVTTGGKILDRLEVDGLNHVEWSFSHTPAPGRQWFYVRVVHSNGAMAWSSPIFTPVK